MSKRQIEVRTRDPYTHIPNAVIRDKNLRLQTRAVLILMLLVKPTGILGRKINEKV